MLASSHDLRCLPYVEQGEVFFKEESTNVQLSPLAYHHFSILCSAAMEVLANGCLTSVKTIVHVLFVLLYTFRIVS